MKRFLITAILPISWAAFAQCTTGATQLLGDGKLYGCVEGQWKKLTEDIVDTNSSIVGIVGNTWYENYNVVGREGNNATSQLPNFGNPPISIADAPTHVVGKIYYSNSQKHFYQGVANGLWHQIDNMVWSSTKSVSLSGTFIKNNCVAPSRPYGTVTYNSPLFTITETSTISQNDADIKAQNTANYQAQTDVNFNGQAYANANGTCQTIIIPPADPIYTIPQFDYLVIRYYWTSSNGQDFDDATGFTNLAGSPINMKSVGWKPLNPYNFITVGAPPVLQWIADNRGNGYESVLISYKNIPANSPGVTLPVEYKLALAGNWYFSRDDGNVGVQLIAYKGGTMNRNGFLWENIGGQQVFIQSFSKNVASNNMLDGANNLLDQNFSNYSSSQAIGNIIINSLSNTAQLTIYP